MTENDKIEPYYMKRAQEFIDMLVDKGYFRDDVSREETRVIEEYVGYLLQSGAKSAVKMSELMRKVKP